MRLVEQWQGDRVVVRSRDSGVWLGTLLDAEGSSVRLEAAKRAHSWEGAGSCSGLADIGPTGGRIALPVDVVIHDCCEIISATETACAAWDAITPWSGRE